MSLVYDITFSSLYYCSCIEERLKVLLLPHFPLELIFNYYLPCNVFLFLFKILLCLGMFYGWPGAFLFSKYSYFCIWSIYILYSNKLVKSSEKAVKSFENLSTSHMWCHHRPTHWPHCFSRLRSYSKFHDTQMGPLWQIHTNSLALHVSVCASVCVLSHRSHRRTLDLTLGVPASSCPPVTAGPTAPGCDRSWQIKLESWCQKESCYCTQAWWETQRLERRRRRRESETPNTKRCF